MKILTLEIDGFRSLRSQTWTPGDLNVVIGPNASGKSNLLRVLELLGAAASGELGAAIRQEGGMESIVWDGTAERVRIRAKTTPLPPYTDPATDAFTYEFTLARLGRTGTYQLEHEILGNFSKVETGEMTEPFKLLERDPRHAAVFSMDSQRFEAPPESLPEGECLLSVAGGPFGANRYVTGFQQELRAWRIYQWFETHRNAAVRGPQVTRSERTVDPDGQNLISVLHSLYTEDWDFRNELDVAMRAAFGDDFQELVFPPAADQRIQLRVKWRSLRRAQPAVDLSDGTLRFLFLLAILANPSPPSLIAIDEPETGLHPSMLPIIAEYAREASSRSQVILTTHSPEFLDAFGDDPPTTTVTERQDGETQLRIVSGDDLAYWLQQYSLGELYRSSELEAMP